MKIDKTKILIYSVLGISFLILVGWFSYNYYSSKQPKEAENTNLGLDVDTKYTYEDMVKSNEKKEDQGVEYQYKNTPTTVDYSNQTSTKSISDDNRYAAEKQQVQNVMYNIQRQKEITAQEANHDIAPESTTKRSNSIARLISYHKNVPEDESQEPKPEKTQKTINKGKLFNDSSDDFGSANTSEVAVPAVIHGEQSIRDGSSVKIRTTQDCTIEGTLVPKNTFVFGQVRISEDRININIGGFRVNGTIISTPLTVYDQDGSLGLMLIGGSGEGVTDKAVDVADASAGNVLSSVPVIGGVAQATKDIFRSRQTRSKQVVLASNYKLILKKS